MPKKRQKLKMSKNVPKNAIKNYLKNGPKYVNVPTKYL